MDYGQIDVLSTSQGCPNDDNDVPMDDVPLVLHIGPYGDVLRTFFLSPQTSGRFSGTTSGCPRDVILLTGITPLALYTSNLTLRP